jgi:glycosyltransferase involved in cell wall biosynthesis
VEKLNLSDSVFFLDVRDDVNELFQAMDVFLFPSKYEGLGIVVVEAQATGLPCVISDTIPSEAYICDTIQVESLYSNVDKWTNDILKCTLYKSRLNMTRNVKACGYDVKDTAKLLEEFYTSYENIR